LNELTALNLQRANLPVHREVCEIHGTTGGHRQPVIQAANTNVYDMSLSS